MLIYIFTLFEATCSQRLSTTLYIICSASLLYKLDIYSVLSIVSLCVYPFSLNDCAFYLLLIHDLSPCSDLNWIIYPGMLYCIILFTLLHETILVHLPKFEKSLLVLMYICTSCWVILFLWYVDKMKTEWDILLMIVILRMIYRPLCVRNIFYMLYFFYLIFYAIFEVPYHWPLSQFSQMLDMTGIFLDVYKLLICLHVWKLIAWLL